MQNTIARKIFLFIISFAMQSMLASTVTLPLEIFESGILKNCFNNQKSINCLKTSYYNFCLLSKRHNEKTKDYWNKNWFSIMEQVCDDYRFERLYFAGIFYHSNDAIKHYFEKHLFIYKKLLYLSSNQVMIYPPKLEWFRTLDPNFTLFGANCQMSLLECCIKASYYPIKNKTELCIDLVNRDAHYNI